MQDKCEHNWEYWTDGSREQPICPRICTTCGLSQKELLNGQVIESFENTFWCEEFSKFIPINYFLHKKLSENIDIAFRSNHEA